MKRQRKWPRLRDIAFRLYFCRGYSSAQWQAGMGIHIQIGATLFGIVDRNYRDRVDGDAHRKNPRILLRIKPAS